MFDGSPARRAFQPRNDKGLDKKLCSMLCQKGPDLSEVVKCKPARSSNFCYVLFEDQLIIKDYTERFLTEADGVIVDEPN